MISADRALEHVLRYCLTPETETVNLLQSTWRVLAQAVVADRDLPPYHRVTMDGIAISTESLKAGNRSFRIENIQPAGSPRVRLEHINNCIEVMTGAVLPEHADAVIPYEQCSIKDGVAAIARDEVPVHQFVHLQGTDEKAGAVLVEKGVRITPATVGIMASVGWSAVPVYRNPKVAICSTGDELVEVTQIPAAHQVRRSNVYALAAALQPEGITAGLFHLPDNPEAMTRALSAVVEHHELVLFSGAVSKGKFDHLPEVLARMGMQEVFHHVAQKPGKPLLFGTFPGKTVVFGLPGNPVSSFVCFHQFVRPWLYRSLQCARPGAAAKLAREVVFRPSLTYHLLVKLTSHNGELLATPCATSGSGDLVSMLAADGILTLPPGRDVFAAGESFPVTLLGRYMY